MLLTASRLFDGTGTAAAGQAWLQLSNGQIDAVGSGPPPAGAAMDFPGCTILPGLIDTHVHLVFSALHSHNAIIAQVGRESDDELLARALANARSALFAGITTVRD